MALSLELLILLIQYTSCVNCLLPWDKELGRKLPTAILFVFGSIVTSATIRVSLRFLRLPIPDSVFVLCTGVGVGFIAHKYETVELMTSFCYIDPQILLVIFLPALLFKISLCTDAQSFVRSSVPIILISVFGCMIQTLIVGYIMYALIDTNWQVYYILFFGSLTCCIYPLETINALKDIGNQTKHLLCLLEGESMVGVCMTLAVYRIVVIVLKIQDIAQMIVTIIWFLSVVAVLVSDDESNNSSSQQSPQPVFVWVARSYYIPFTEQMGLLTGIAFGKVVSLLLRHWHNSINNVVVWSLVVPYAAYYFSDKFFDASGGLCVIGLGICLSIDRLSFTPEVDKFLIYFWELIAHIMHTIILTVVGVRTANELFQQRQNYTFLMIIITYLICNMARLVAFIIVAPFIRYSGFRLGFPDLVVLTWGGLRGIIGALLAMHAGGGIENVYSTQFDPHTLFIHCTGVIFLTALINAPTLKVLLKYLGVTEVSSTKKTNMTNCVKYILEKREKAINTLKLDRFFSDANWPLIADVTIMKHPYQLEIDTDDITEDYIGYRTSTCPECNAEVQNEASPKEILEMSKEAKTRILKAKKISFLKQYEYGFLSREGILALLATNEAVNESEVPLSDMEVLEKVFARKSIMERFRTILVKLITKKEEKRIRPPRRYCRRICYHLIMHPAFDIIMSLIILLNMIPIIYELITKGNIASPGLGYALVSVNTLFFLVYLAEFIVKIKGYSWIYLCSHGFKTYFSKLWNLFDFAVLIFALIDLIFDYTDMFVESFSKNANSMSTYTLLGKATRVIRFVRLFKLCQAWYPNILRYCDTRIDTKLSFAYEVGKGVLTAKEEILEVLPQMIDNDEIRNELRQFIESEKLAMTKQLGLIQKERPWIAITVKSKQAMKTTLNNMKDAVKELKVSGWVDDYEYHKLYDAVLDRLKAVKNIESVPPNEPKAIFREVPWMSSDDEMFEFLFSNVQVLTLDSGDIVCKTGLESSGIYIITRGLFTLSYTPTNDVLNRNIDEGMLPVIDYISNPHFEEKVSDYLVSGNTFGELSTLTGRRYDSEVIAETPSEVFLLPSEIVFEAMQKDNDLLMGLECRIWKMLSLKLAVAILMEVPAYQSQSQAKVKRALERAFVPKLTAFKTFVINEMIEDVILIEGIVIDSNTRDCYVGPCYIDRSTHKLLLPPSSDYYISAPLTPRLLIIPVNEQNEYELMETEEQISQMISTSSARCLHHTVQQKRSKSKIRRKAPGNVFQKLRSKKVSHSEYDRRETLPVMRFHSPSRISSVSESIPEVQTFEMDYRRPSTAVKPSRVYKGSTG